MVQLLEKNHGVSEHIAALLDHLVDYANRRGVKFEDLVLDRPYVDGYDSGFGEYIKTRLTHRS